MPSVGDGRAELAVRVRTVGGACLLVARGQIDVSTVPELHLAVEDALRADGPVVVDLRAVSFLDSTGLHALLVLRQRLTEQSRRLAVACRPDGAVAMALAVSGTDRIFEVRATREDAMAAARAVETDSVEGVFDLARRVGAGVLAEALRHLRTRP